MAKAAISTKSDRGNSYSGFSLIGKMASGSICLEIPYIVICREVRVSAGEFYYFLKSILQWRH